MPDITLGSGSLIDDRVVLHDGELERAYEPVVFVKSVKASVVRQLEALNKITEQAMRRLGIDRTKLAQGEKVSVAFTDAEVARRLRVMCDTISLLVKSKGADAPEAGDLLYAAWDDDKLADFQIVQLYHTLVGGDEDAADPS